LLTTNDYHIKYLVKYSAVKMRDRHSPATPAAVNALTVCRHGSVDDPYYIPSSVASFRTFYSRVSCPSMWRPDQLAASVLRLHFFLCLFTSLRAVS